MLSEELSHTCYVQLSPQPLFKVKTFCEGEKAFCQGEIKLLSNWETPWSRVEPFFGKSLTKGMANSLDQRVFGLTSG